MAAYDIILLGGQSNASGTGVGSVTDEYVPSDDILLMAGDGTPSFEKVGENYCLCLNEQGIYPIRIAEEATGAAGKIGNFALIFAKRYAKTYLKAGRKVLIINAAIGGTGFARPEWGVGNMLHTRMRNMLDKGLSTHPQNRVVAFLWHQGEHDAFENADWDPDRRYRVHKENLTATLEDFYTAIGDSSVPFIAAGFCNEWYLQNAVSCDAVLAAIRECCEAFDGAFVETADLLSNNQTVGNNDPIHFSRESLHILGKRYFDAYEQLLQKRKSL